MPNKAIVLIVLALLCAPAAFAQDSSQAPDAKARVRLGPLALNPTLGLTNAGVDTNVYNESDPLNPKSDFTMTVQPGTDMWLRFGRSWLTANIREDLVYYQKYADQRTANNFDTLELKVPFNRLTLKGGGRYANTSDRPGYEISERIHHVDTGGNAAVELRVLSKTFVGVRGDRTTYNYDDNAEFFGARIRTQLARTGTTAGVTLRHQLTPLTALTFDASRLEDRFQFDRTRNSNSTQVAAGVQFDPYALIKGSASIGYRDFEGLDPTLQSFKGLTAAVDLTYVAFGATKLGVNVMRDVEYSFDTTHPYYVQNAVRGSISQQVYGPFDVVARAGLARMAYQDRIGTVVPYPNEIDHVETFGGGAGYRLGQDVRIGFNVDSMHRTSPNPFWNYHGLVMGMSVTYGY